MATVDCTPDAAASFNDGNWNATGGTWPGVVQTNDGDTSYEWIEMFWTNERIRGSVQNLPSGAIAVNQVDVHELSRKTAAGSYGSQSLHYAASTYYYSTFHANTTSYADYTYTIAYGPGGGWTVSNFNSTEWGLRAGVGGVSGIFVRCTQLYVHVDYTPGGGCIIRAFSHLLPLLGTITTLADLAIFLNYAHAKIHDSIPVYTMDELRMIERKIKKMNRGYAFLREAA